MAEGGALPSCGQPISPSLNEKSKVPRGSPLDRLLQKTLVILSIDGGGVRGLIPAVILGKMERAVQDKMQENFEDFGGPEPDPDWKLLDCVDFLVGTSTGGIIALAWGQLNLPIDKVEGIYRDNDFLNLVFDPGWKDLRAFFRLFISYKAMYHRGELEKKMTSLVPPDGIKELALGEDIPMIFVTAMNNTTKPRQGWLFRNYKQLASRVKPGYDSNDQVKVVDAALATSAAPLVFKEHKVQVQNYVLPFSDGGQLANHPGKLAWDEVNEFVANFKEKIEKAPPHQELKEKLEFPKKIILISIGTGKNPPDVGVDDSSVKKRFREFISQLTDTKSVHEELEREQRKTGSQLKYLRINPDLANINAFKSNQACINYMKTVTETYLQNCDDYKSAIESLVEVSGARTSGSSDQAQDPATT